MNHFVLIIDPSVTSTSTPTSSQLGSHRDPEIEQKKANSTLRPISENPLFEDFFNDQLASCYVPKVPKVRPCASSRLSIKSVAKSFFSTDTFFETKPIFFG